MEEVLHILLTKSMVFFAANASEDFEPVLNSDFISTSLVKYFIELSYGLQWLLLQPIVVELMFRLVVVIEAACFPDQVRCGCVLVRKVPLALQIGRH